MGHLASPSVLRFAKLVGLPQKESSRSILIQNTLCTLNHLPKQSTSLTTCWRPMAPTPTQPLSSRELAHSYTLRKTSVQVFRLLKLFHPSIRTTSQLISSREFTMSPVRLPQYRLTEQIERAIIWPSARMRALQSGAGTSTAPCG